MKLIMYSNPKTGTSTVEFNALRNLPSGSAMVINRPNEMDFDTLTSDEIFALSFISGHRMNAKRVSRIRKLTNDIEVITLFRNPVDQIISAYNYDMNHKYRLIIPFWIWYFFLIPRNPQASHFVRRYQGRWLASFFLGIRHFRQLVKGYDNFDKVIMTDQIDSDIPVLFKNHGILLLNNKLVRRKSTGVDYVTHISLNAKLKKRLECNNRLDMELYHYFKNRD